MVGAQRLADRVLLRGDHVQHAGGNVGLFGDETAEPRSRPGCCGRGLQDDGASRGERRAHLGQVDLMREVPRRDRCDDADGFAAQRAARPDAERRCLAQVGLPCVALGDIGGVPQPLDGHVELGAVGERDGASDLGDRVCPDVVGVGLERRAELAQAAHAQCDVVGPTRLVERPAGRGGGAVDVAVRRVGCDADHPAGRRVDVVVGGGTRCRDEFAVDEQQRIVHVSPRLR